MNENPLAGKISSMKASGASQEGALQWMSDASFTTSQALKALRLEYSLSLSEAKTALSTHPAWGKISLSSEQLQEDALAALGHDLVEEEEDS